MTAVNVYHNGLQTRVFTFTMGVIPMLDSLRYAAVVALLVACCLSGSHAKADPQLPENLATQAKVTASAEYNANYRAANLVDGQIPGAMSRDDVGKAWCVRGHEHPDGVTVTFEWPQPVTIATVVYYGRTAFHLGENWKDYEIRVGESARAGGQGTAQSRPRTAERWTCPIP